MVMDWVDLPQLLVGSHVCAKWHAVARAQPTFWRNIRLAALSTTALDLFLARIDCPSTRSIRLIVDLADQPMCDALQAVVLTAITRHLHRVSYLGLRLHSDVGPLLMAALSSRPAPSLTSLSLRFFHCTEEHPAVILSPDLFSGSCPRLQSVTLDDARLPEHRPMAFDTTDTLIFEFNRARAFPFEIFDQFPKLRNLAVVGESCLPVAGHPEDASLSPTSSSLEGLEIYLARCTYDPVILSIPSIASVPHILCKQPRDGIARLFVDHLQGPIELSLFRVLNGLVHISLYSPAADRGRTIVELESAIPAPDGWTRSVICAPELLERVTTLRVCDAFVHLAPHLDEMPNCHTLDIVVDKEGRPLPSVEIPSPLRLPALKTVLVGTDEAAPKTSVSVSSDALHSLLTQLLGAPASRPSLRLHGVVVSGDSGPLFSDFEQVA
ncbi:hypothetical protein AURDEDRAFT_114507 [Auricularia subglabra TFB-10046 SS5]|nr:hypothetical protein AURDEDRAFT_114507 [Auricularia subglabra TFB-10046 SS5]